MTDRASSPTDAVANHDGPSSAMRKRGSSAPTRELAQRLSGTDEVLLLWHPEIDRVDLSVSDVVTGEGFHIQVAPGNAMDAFNHPYAYAARRATTYHPGRAGTTIVDG